jgi:hypothetical protein
MSGNDVSTSTPTDGAPTYIGGGDPRFTDYYPAWLDNLADDVTVEGSMLDGAAQGTEAKKRPVRPLFRPTSIDLAIQLVPVLGRFVGHSQPPSFTQQAPRIRGAVPDWMPSRVDQRCRPIRASPEGVASRRAQPTSL